MYSQEMFLSDSCPVPPSKRPAHRCEIPLNVLKLKLNDDINQIKLHTQVRQNAFSRSSNPAESAIVNPEESRVNGRAVSGVAGMIC